MSKTRRKSDEKKQESNSSLLGNLNIGDILGIINALDLSKLTSSGNSGSTSSSKKSSSNRAEGNNNVINVSEESTTVSDAKENTGGDIQRDEIIKAINTLIKADRNLLIQVVVEVFGLNKSANNKK